LNEASADEDLRFLFYRSFSTLTLPTLKNNSASSFIRFISSYSIDRGLLLLKFINIIHFQL